MVTRTTKAEKIQLWISMILRFTLVIAIFRSLWGHQWLFAFLSMFTLTLTFLPAFIEKNIKINLPAELEFFVIVFLYLAIFLGETQDYYRLYPWWDIMLHGFAGIVLGFLGFLTMYVLYSGRKIGAAAGLIAIIAFCFALATGALWEIFEFAMDQFFGTNMQKSGLIDTMTDLMIDSAGAIITSVAGYLYLVSDRKSYVMHPILTKFVKENPKMFDENKKKEK